MSALSPYLSSSAVKVLNRRLKTKKRPRIAFLDIDSTLTMPEMSDVTNEVRKKLEKKGYVVAFVTSKTEEMLITDNQRDISEDIHRPLPHLGKDPRGKRYYTDPKNTELPGVQNPDLIMGSTGTSILIKKQKGGYVMDNLYKKNFPQPAFHWREAVLEIIKELNTAYNLAQLHPNEFIENYEIGKTDIAPPDYRVELKFKTLKKKKEFIRYFKTQADIKELSVQFTDDSNPQKEKYALYVTPKNATKVHAVEHVVKSLLDVLKIKPQDLEVLIAGDSYPDLAMGLYGGLNTDATFLLVGESRLTAFLVDEEIHSFADESLKIIKQHLVAMDTNRPGYYHFILRGTGKRTVIIGDEVFSTTKGPQTLLAYLNAVDKKNLV